MSGNKVIVTDCCEDCHMWNSCETKQKRGVIGETQACCHFCERFPQCNSAVHELGQSDHSKNLIKVIENSVKEKQFITAQHFALLLPTKDFPTLKDLKDVYIDAFSENKDQQVLNEGMLLFHNLFDQAERKIPVLINLAYFEEYSNPVNADQAVLKALEEKPPLEYIIKFYRWLRDKQKKPDYLKRLSMVSQRAENSALQKFCKEFEVINLLSRSNNHILVINKLESHISEFRNDIDVVEIGKWINRFLNSASDGLKDLGDNCSKSSKGEEAIRCYKEALKGFHIFIEVRPDEATNFASMIIILGKILDALKKLKINGDERKKVAEQIRTYGEQAVKLILQLHNEGRYYACRKYGLMFEILGEINDGDTAISCFQSGAEWFNKAAERFKPPKDPIAEMRLLQVDAIAKGNCLRKLQRYDEAIGEYETILNKYPDWYEGYMEKGKTLMEVGNYEEAEKWHKKCIELKPSDIPAYDSLSILYKKWGKYNEAIRAWVKYMRLPVVKNNKESLDWGFFHLAELYEDWGKDEIAANFFKYIISKRQPDRPKAHYRLAQIYMRHFEWNKAAEVLENKIKIPDNEPFHDYCNLGDCYKKMGDRNKGLEYYTKAESVSPIGLPVLTRIAKFFEEECSFEKAIEYVSKNIEILGDRSNTAENYIWRGDLYKKKDYLPQACQDYLKAQELNPFLEKAYQRLDTLPPSIYDINIVVTQINSLESCLSSITPDNHAYKRTALSLVQKYMQARKPENAEKAMDLLDSIYSSDSVEYWINKAMILKELKKDLHNAIDCKSKLLDMLLPSQDEKLQIICTLIGWNLEANQKSKAANLFKQLEKIKPIESLEELDPQIFYKFRETYHFVAKLSLKGRDYRASLRYANLLLEKINHDDMHYLTYRGMSLIGLKRLDKADEVFDFLLSKYPNDAMGYYQKGEIQWKRRELDKAERYFENALRLSKEANDRKGILSALNRLIKVSARKNDHDKVIERATEFLNIEDDPVIRTNRAESLIALNQKEKGLEDFKHIFEESPSDAIAARKLISSLGLQRGFYPPEVIQPLFDSIQDPRYTSNIIDRLTELSIFTNFELINSILNQYSNNSYIRSSVAHYLMRYAIYHFFKQTHLKEEIQRTISLFKSLNNGESFKELLVDYWGSEKGAYLEFYADMFEEDFKKVDEMIARFDFKNKQLKEVMELVKAIEGLQDTVKSKDITGKMEEIPNSHLHGLLDYMGETFKNFLSVSLDKGYWDNVKKLVGQLDTNAQDILDTCLNYTIMQINTHASLCKVDLESSVTYYHKIKNKFLWIDLCLRKGSQPNEDDQKKIMMLEKKVQSFIRTCRFPRLEYVSPLEIADKVAKEFEGSNLPVRFTHENVTEDDELLVDPLRIKDCIENLIFNARNAIIDKNKETGKIGEDFIHVRLAKEDGRFVISCEDTGIGMSLEQKENFLKCKTSGLGSPCIMRTVKNHNGEIFIESEPGNGTKVKILFNLKEERYE